MLAFKQDNKRLIKSKRLKHQRHNINTIQRLRHSNPREFWKLFNSKSSNKLTPNINIEEFYEYFSKLQDELPKSTNIEAEQFVKNHSFDSDGVYEELYIPITVSELMSVVKELKQNKAPGNDNLLNEYFVSYIDILSSHLVDLYLTLYLILALSGFMDRRHYYPVIQKRGSWKCTVITLLSCMSKLFTAILNKRINKVIEDNNVLSDAQFGFNNRRMV